MSIWPHKTPQPPASPTERAPGADPVPPRPAATGDAVPDPARAEASDDALLAAVLRQSRIADADPAPPPPQGAAQAALSWTLPGFDRRCRVSTIFGDLPIEALRRHDKVKTLSGAYLTVERIDEIRLDADFLARHAEAHPVQIRMRSFAAGQPVRNTLVSPAQTVATRAHVGSATATVARDLVGLPGICRMPQAEMTYYRFHCGTGATVCIDGAWFGTDLWN